VLTFSFQDLNLDQLIPMEDEENGVELRIISSSFADPYLLILREDSSVKVFKANDTGEIEELECPEISSTKWLYASLFQSSIVQDVFAFLLMPEGGLKV
jgi:cleavage and polyadenylation specificity factor subunit 1